jgi:hypothetical protein
MDFFASIDDKLPINFFEKNIHLSSNTFANYVTREGSKAG